MTTRHQQLTGLQNSLTHLGDLESALTQLGGARRKVEQAEQLRSEARQEAVLRLAPFVGQRATIAGTVIESEQRGHYPAESNGEYVPLVNPRTGQDHLERTWLPATKVHLLEVDADGIWVSTEMPPVLARKVELDTIARLIPELESQPIEG